tara:strand:- start:1544 stop:2629 length:1086 start_codon:yes stop_codon:yes gene_type:complete
MIDINFFKSSNNIKNRITKGLVSINQLEEIEKELDELRSKKPIIYNIETTNYCNMKCVMCPRTLYMTRKNIWIDDDLFDKLTNQVTTHDADSLKNFWEFIENDYKQDVNEVSENGFYFSIVSRCLILHGFGEPFLDKKLVERIKMCTSKNIPTYFSCTPATMTVEKAKKVMDAGLDVLKFSLDAMEEKKIQEIRGKRANFEDSVKKILELIEYKKNNNLKTLLVPCMIDMAEKDIDLKMHEDFINFWKKYDVYAYIKSQDNRWLYETEENIKKNKSHYAKQYCEYPWLSVSIMADGNVVPCTQISNNELVLGNINKQSLEDIWNGPKYKELRKMHITGNFPPNHKCDKKCDMKKIYQYTNK